MPDVSRRRSMVAACWRPWLRLPTASAALLLVLATCGCTRIPRDPDGTLDRVATTGTFRVGVISPGPDGADTARSDAFLRHVSLQTRAQARLVDGPAERLLSALEEGELDVVVGELSADSPWRSRVTMLPPLEAQRSDGKRIELTVSARNGENAWIATLFEATTKTTQQGATP